MPATVKVPVPSTLPRKFQLFITIWLFTGFLTQLTFVPFIRNNIGPFEVCGILALLMYPGFRLRSLRTSHPVVTTLLLIALVAAISQIQLPQSHRRVGLIQVAIMCFLFVFVALMGNISKQHRLSPSFFLRAVTYAVLVIGPWIIFTGISSGGDIQAAGPFRNRAHMASYMLTAFWMILILALWPGLEKKLRYASYAGLGLTLYAVAVSGRRSVYLSLIVGLVSLAFVMAGASRGKRFRLFVTTAFVLAFLGGLYRAGDSLTPQAGFFKKRITEVGDRLKLATGVTDSIQAENSFYALQRRGVIHAFRTNPILGIGWGGFPQSQYSPTGHEVHSTPLRFLAEMGIVGLALYSTLLGLLLGRSWKLFKSMRRSPYSASYLALMTAIWSMSISYLYNRHVTERTFWIFLAVFLSAEAFAGRWHSLRTAMASDPRTRGLLQPAPATRLRRSA